MVQFVDFLVPEIEEKIIDQNLPMVCIAYIGVFVRSHFNDKFKFYLYINQTNTLIYKYLWKSYRIMGKTGDKVMSSSIKEQRTLQCLTYFS